MTIDKKSWGYRAEAKLEDFFTVAEIIKGNISVSYNYIVTTEYNEYTLSTILELAKTVSTGGNILINVGPTQNGLIQPIFVERLRGMGSWLKINGDAIYGSKPWIYQNDTKTPDVWYTRRSKTHNDQTVVYAIILKYPYDSAGVCLYALGGRYSNTTTARILGYPDELKVCMRRCDSKSFFRSMSMRILKLI